MVYIVSPIASIKQLLKDTVKYKIKILLLDNTKESSRWETDELKKPCVIYKIKSNIADVNPTISLIKY